MILTALLLLVQSSVSPSAPAGAAPAASAAAAPSKVRASTSAADPGQTVCKTDNATGHRIATRVCHTRAEWDGMERSANAFFGTRQSGCTPGQSC